MKKSDRIELRRRRHFVNRELRKENEDMRRAEALLPAVRQPEVIHARTIPREPRADRDWDFFRAVFRLFPF